MLREARENTSLLPYERETSLSCDAHARSIYRVRGLTFTIFNQGRCQTREINSRHANRRRKFESAPIARVEPNAEERSVSHNALERCGIGKTRLRATTYMANRFVSADTFMAATISLWLRFEASALDTRCPIKDTKRKRSLSKMHSPSNGITTSRMYYVKDARLQQTIINNS